MSWTPKDISSHKNASLISKQVSFLFRENQTLILIHFDFSARHGTYWRFWNYCQKIKHDKHKQLKKKKASFLNIQQKSAIKWYIFKLTKNGIETYNQQRSNQIKTTVVISRYRCFRFRVFITCRKNGEEIENEEITEKRSEETISEKRSDDKQ